MKYDSFDDFKYFLCGCSIFGSKETFEGNKHKDSGGGHEHVFVTRESNNVESQLHQDTVR